MRIGMLAFLHESNTFSSQPTNLVSFEQNLFASGESIRELLAESHHEVGGFFAGLAESEVEAVPLFAARALPSGTIEADTYDIILDRILASLGGAGRLDGLLVAPHGATVSERFPDADGHWLSEVRAAVGHKIPIIGTLDAHANLSEAMVQSCNALIAYRTNPHLDQRDRGIEAARMLTATARGDINPVMAARFPPLAINIEKQCIEEAHLRPLYDFADQQLTTDGILSNSILLGFPYADVAEMGSAVITIADGDQTLADQQASELASEMWTRRENFNGPMTSIESAVEACRDSAERICLLDMGDNVGGGSSADGTMLLAALHANALPRAFGCLYDPEAVDRCVAAGIGSTLKISVGGKTDALHGSPLDIQLTVKSIHDGQFREPQPRHGGIVEFDQGRTVICVAASGLTLMLTSRRMVPFSLQQLISCNLDPRKFRVLVAKGVNAPIAAYRDVCDRFIRVNTAGSTCADMTQLSYQHRRRPMFPFEPSTQFESISS